MQIARAAAQQRYRHGRAHWFKLGSLADQQGLNSHAMLVTLTPPTPAEAQRARSQQIELIAGKGLGELGERLHDWICGGPAAGSRI